MDTIRSYIAGFMVFTPSSSLESIREGKSSNSNTALSELGRVSGDEIEALIVGYTNSLGVVRVGGSSDSSLN